MPVTVEQREHHGVSRREQKEERQARTATNVCMDAIATQERTEMLSRSMRDRRHQNRQLQVDTIGHL
jgi:hypothetical protein